MKRRLAETSYRDIDEMKVALDEIARSFSIETVHALIDSMPKRIEAVIESRGEMTRY